MKVIFKAVTTIAALSFAVSVFAASAFFTGRQEMVTTVTYQQAWRCEYNYNGQMLYFIFSGVCPSSVEVR
jgi:hypothetical protein